MILKPETSNVFMTIRHSNVYSEQCYPMHTLFHCTMVDLFTGVAVYTYLFLIKNMARLRSMWQTSLNRRHPVPLAFHALQALTGFHVLDMLRSMPTTWTLILTTWVWNTYFPTSERLTERKTIEVLFLEWQWHWQQDCYANIYQRDLLTLALYTGTVVALQVRKDN